MKKLQPRERARDILSREVGYVRKPHGGRLRVALVFPNTYFVGMSSLGFQTVYRLFNELDDVVCERAFLPPKQELQDQLASGAPLLTLESQTPVADFDVIAFSVVVRMGLHEPGHDAAAGEGAAAGRGAEQRVIPSWWSAAP